mgnify:CR=1 FL=1
MKRILMLLCCAACLAGRGAPVSAAEAPVLDLVHVARGLWDTEYRVDEAIYAARYPQMADSWYSQSIGFGSVGGWNRTKGWIPRFPWTAEDVEWYGAIIIGNVNVQSINKPAMDALPAFVENGGVLVLLGGRFAFGGSIAGTSLEALAPATFTAPYDLAFAEAGLPLSAGPKAPAALAKLDWAAAPKTWWYHAVTAKPDAEAWIMSGDKPILLVRRQGGGAVAMFFGTVMGEAANGVPFWEWKDWTACLAAVLTELRGTAGPGRAAWLAGARAKAAAPLVAVLTEGKAADAALISVFRCGPDRAGLEKLLADLAESDSTISAGSADMLIASLALQRTAAYSAGGMALVRTGAPEKVRVGLCALAIAGAADAYPLFESAARGQAVKPESDDLEEDAGAASPALAGTGSADGSIDTVKQLKDTAIFAFGAFGDAKAVAFLEGLRTASKSGAFAPGSMPETIEEAQFQYQMATLALLGCGKAELAKEAAGFLLEDEYVLCRARSKVSSIPGYVAPAQKLLPQTLANRAKIHLLATALPDGPRAALDAELATCGDWRVTALRCRLHR